MIALLTAVAALRLPPAVSTRRDALGLAAATASEADPVIAAKIGTAQVMAVISWCTYPIVYLFPMLGFSAGKAVVSIQLGYCVSDIISKCGVGLVIYQISYAKSSKQNLLQ